MRHCSSCKHYQVDLVALDLGLFAYCCALNKLLITHPFFKGLFCKNYKKRSS